MARPGAGVNVPILPVAPDRYDRTSEAALREILAQFMREVSARLGSLQDAINALDERVTDLEP